MTTSPELLKDAEWFVIRNVDLKLYDLLAEFAAMKIRECAEIAKPGCSRKCSDDACHAEWGVYDRILRRYGLDKEAKP